jgi:hypothetical protein
MTARAPESFLAGTAEMISLPTSRVWTLLQDGAEILRARRHVWQRCSVLETQTRTWVVVPDGWGTCLLLDHQGEEEARAIRDDWWGRRWSLAGRRPFNYQLWAESMLRRRWSVGQAGQEIMGIAGGRTSFNRIIFRAELPVPLQAVALTWHIVVRAWEASGRGEAALGAIRRSSPVP